MRPQRGLLTDRFPVLEGHDGWVSNVMFCPDGATILTVGDDNTARIWDTKTGECWRVLLGLKTSWAVLNSDLTVERIGPDVWKYLNGVVRAKDGTPSITTSKLAFSSTD